LGTSNRKKVLIVDNSRYPTGAFYSILNFTNRLSDDFDFYYAVPKGCWQDCKIDRERLFTFEYIELQKNIQVLSYLPRLIKNTVKLKRVLDRHSIEIVHIGDLYNMVGISAKLTLRNLKLVYHVRLLKSSYVGKFYQVWKWLISRFADRIICVSKAVVMEMGGIPKTNLIYDMVAPNLENPKKPNAGDSNSIDLLYVGNFIPGKGQDLALKAFKSALEKVPNLRLKFMGSDFGSDRNRKYIEALHSYIQKWNLGDYVELAGPCNDVFMEMSKSDIVLNFSESESFSMVCLEALACRVPIIATMSGGPQEIIQHQVNGLLVANKNLNEMAIAIVQLATDKTMRQRFSENSQLDFQHKFNAEVLTDKLRQLYLSLLH